MRKFSQSRWIALVGNPNAGKSAVFHALTGMYVEVSNYPGTTVDVHRAAYGGDLLIDTPGIYGLSMLNDEERVAREIILQADCVVNVVDAVRLQRDLFLTLQLVDLGVPMVLALNMMDELEQAGMKIDMAKLSNLLGIPVVPLVAIRGEGIDQLRTELARPRRGRRDPWLQTQLDQLHRQCPAIRSPREALLVLEGDPVFTERYGVKPDCKERIYMARRRRVDRLVGQCVQWTHGQVPKRPLLDRLLTQPATGFPLLLVALGLLYYLVGVVVAQGAVDFLQEKVFQGIYEPWMASHVHQLVSPQSLLGKLLVGPYGVLTTAVTYLFGLLLPLVIGFQLVLGLLEDSGYLPRVAVLADRALTKLGLNGKAVIPLLLGFGCVTMALISTRILNSRREQTIATILLCLAIPCSSTLGIIIIMLVPLGLRAVLFYLGLSTAIFLLAGAVLAWRLPGRSTHLLIDLPPLRWPRIWNVLQKATHRSLAFLRDAGPLFLLAMLLISLLDWLGLMSLLEWLLSPITTRWLMLPKESTVPLILGLLRRDFGAVGLYSLQLSPGQQLVAVITITFFVPCLASMLVLFKERGTRQGSLIFLGTLGTAILLGGLVAHLVL